MTDEELALKAKTGDEAALMKLWKNKRSMAYKWAQSYFWKYWEQGDTRGADLEDYMQCAFIALMQAVHYYDPEKPYAFSTCFGNLLKREFADLLRTRESHKKDALNGALSYEAPMSGNNDDTDLWIDMIADPVDCIEEAEDRIFQEQQHETIEEALTQIPEKQSMAVRLRYLENRTWPDVSARMNFEHSYVRRLAHRAIESLRKDEIRMMLEPFYEPYVDQQTDFYRKGSVKQQMSPIEENVIWRERLREQEIKREQHDTYRQAAV